jgi:hypothetical protein
MANITSQRDIESKVLDILKQSKALDVFPTPVDRIVYCADLIVDGTIDLAHYKEPFLKKLVKPLKNALIDLRGFVDRREKIIYVDHSMRESRKNFVKLHETGHIILPWQAAILNCAENDETLNPLVDEEFEAEANYFASAAFFQLDRFDAEVRKLGLGIDSARALSTHFGASIHASLRRMVEFQNKRCALVVLEGKTKDGCTTKDVFQSESFKNYFGEILLPEKLDREFRFAADYLNNRRHLLDQNVSLPTTTGLIEMKYQFFYNGYNGFVFLYPEGELPKPKINYIVKERGH